MGFRVAVSAPVEIYLGMRARFLFEFPQRQSAYCTDVGKALPSTHSFDSPAALTPIVSSLSDTEPETM
jgi:hypothetical protein